MLLLYHMQYLVNMKCIIMVEGGITLKSYNAWHLFLTINTLTKYFGHLAQDCSYSSLLLMELLQSSTKPYICLKWGKCKKILNSCSISVYVLLIINTFSVYHVDIWEQNFTITDQANVTTLNSMLNGIMENTMLLWVIYLPLMLCCLQWTVTK